MVLKQKSQVHLAQDLLLKMETVSSEQEDKQSLHKHKIARFFYNLYWKTKEAVQLFKGRFSLYVLCCICMYFDNVVVVVIDKE